MTGGFKIGYYYKYIGDKNYCINNNDMRLMLDNKWHKCIYVDNNIYAKFEGTKHTWVWMEEDFIESKYNPYIKKLLEEI